MICCKIGVGSPDGGSFDAEKPLISAHVQVLSDAVVKQSVVFARNGALNKYHHFLEKKHLLSDNEDHSRRVSSTSTADLQIKLENLLTNDVLDLDTVWDDDPAVAPQPPDPRPNRLRLFLPLSDLLHFAQGLLENLCTPDNHPEFHQGFADLGGGRDATLNPRERRYPSVLRNIKINRKRFSHKELPAVKVLGRGSKCGGYDDQRGWCEMLRNSKKGSGRLGAKDVAELLAKDREDYVVEGSSTPAASPFANALEVFVNLDAGVEVFVPGEDSAGKLRPLEEVLPARTVQRYYRNTSSRTGTPIRSSSSTGGVHDEAGTTGSAEGARVRRATTFHGGVHHDNGEKNEAGCTTSHGGVHHDDGGVQNEKGWNNDRRWDNGFALQLGGLDVTTRWRPRLTYEVDPTSGSLVLVERAKSPLELAYELLTVKEEGGVGGSPPFSRTPSVSSTCVGGEQVEISRLETALSTGEFDSAEYDSVFLEAKFSAEYVFGGIEERFLYSDRRNIPTIGGTAAGAPPNLPDEDDIRFLLKPAIANVAFRTSRALDSRLQRTGRPRHLFSLTVAGIALPIAPGIAESPLRLHLDPLKIATLVRTGIQLFPALLKLGDTAKADALAQKICPKPEDPMPKPNLRGQPVKNFFFTSIVP